uniref:(California timema) hypothetical protein n=1 Tax=Timema californicum TaxID=61474 RepID=A0A7R9JE00_TIMCA|nr:unnamed protein product [Timema californicum]
MELSCSVPRTSLTTAVESCLLMGVKMADNVRYQERQMLSLGVRLRHGTPDMGHHYNNLAGREARIINQMNEPIIIGAQLLQRQFSDSLGLSYNNTAEQLLSQGLEIGGVTEGTMCRRVRQGHCKDLNSRPFRSLDGSCNNIANPTWGMSQTALNRLLPTRLALFSISVSGAPLPNARLLSRTFFPDRDLENQEWTLIAMLWGQMASHDLALVPMVQIDVDREEISQRETQGKAQFDKYAEQLKWPTGEPKGRTEGIQCCSDDGESILPAQLLHPACMPLFISSEDRFYSAFSQHCMNFVRSMTTVGQDCKLSSAEQAIALTHHHLSLGIVTQLPTVFKSV